MCVCVWPNCSAARVVDTMDHQVLSVPADGGGAFG